MTVFCLQGHGTWERGRALTQSIFTTTSLRTDLAQKNAEKTVQIPKNGKKSKTWAKDHDGHIFFFDFMETQKN